MKPVPFGFPAWKHCKRRIAKKYLRGRRLFYRYWQFHNCERYTMINDCSGYNMKPTEVTPRYIKIGRKSEVLIDIHFIGETNSCSFYSCGVEPALPLSEIKRRVNHILEYWDKHGDPWEFRKRQSERIVHEDGTFEWKKEG